MKIIGTIGIVGIILITIGATLSISIIFSAIRRIWRISKLHCPECDSELEIYHDSSIDKNIYVCKKCGKEWI